MYQFYAIVKLKNRRSNHCTSGTVTFPTYMNEAKIKTKPPTLAASRYDEENARKWTLHSQSAENR